MAGIPNEENPSPTVLLEQPCMVLVRLIGNGCDRNCQGHDRPGRHELQIACTDNENGIGDQRQMKWSILYSEVYVRNAESPLRTQ